MSLVQDYNDEDSEQAGHTPLEETVKHESSIYAVTQAFQTGLPGVNARR